MPAVASPERRHHRRVRQEIPVGAAGGVSACVEPRRSRGDARHRDSGRRQRVQGSSQPAQIGVIGQHEADDLPACVHACVGPTGHPHDGRGAEDGGEGALQAALHREQPVLLCPAVQSGAVVLQFHAVIALHTSLPPATRSERARRPRSRPWPGYEEANAGTPWGTGTSQLLVRAQSRVRPVRACVRPAPDTPSRPRRPGVAPDGLCACIRPDGRRTWERSR